MVQNLSVRNQGNRFCIRRCGPLDFYQRTGDEFLLDSAILASDRDHGCATNLHIPMTHARRLW